MKRCTDDGHTMYHILHALLYHLCGARSGSPQLLYMPEKEVHLEKA